jgi:hypothetical protein
LTYTFKDHNYLNNINYYLLFKENYIIYIIEFNLCGSYIVYNIYPKWIESYESYTENYYKNYYTYSLGVNPNYIKYLEKYPNKINWYSLSKNENSIEFLKSEIINSNLEIKKLK